MNLSKKSKYIFFILLGASFLALNFGILAMHMDDSGNMFCPFFNSVAICPMDLSGHITYFENIFGAIPLNTFWAIISLIAIALSFTITTERIKPKEEIRHIPLKFKSNLSAFNKLILAFSDGIIQPKLYA